MQVKNESILDCLKNNGKIFGLLSAIGGFIGDVLQPLAPFSEYIFYILLICMIPLLLIYFFSKNFKNRVTPLLSFSIIFSFISGGLFGLQLASNNNDKGVLSAVVPGIEKIQISLGVIDKKLISIKEDTEEIKKSTKNISGKLDTLNQNIGKQGGIILNPSTSEEWYSNARLYELKGDYGKARHSYIKYFSFNGKYLDPHIRFQRFLKIQEGLEGAREVYNSLFEEDKNIVVVYAKLLLGPSKFKQNTIASFIKSHPKFAPAYYELANQYSKSVLGRQTLTDKRLEYKNYEQFIALNEKGLLGRYYLDKDKMLKMLKIAKSKIVAIDANGINIFNDPIVSFYLSVINKRLGNIIIQIVDLPIEIYYKLEGDANFTPFSKHDNINPDTGKPDVNLEVDVKLPHLNSQTIKIKYRDFRGILRGPYEYKVDPKKIIVAESIEQLKKRFVPNDMLSISSLDYSFDFSRILLLHCGLSKIQYGLNNNVPNIDIPTATCDYEEPYTHRLRSRFWVPFDGKTVKFISFRVIYANGEKSKIKIYQLKDYDAPLFQD